VLCGGGNNGGDGFVIARHLKRRGFTVKVYLFVKRERLKGIALLNYERLSYFNITVKDCSETEYFENERQILHSFDFFIDSLLGIGFHGAPKGIIREGIDFINTCTTPVISVDMPSGIDANGEQTESLHAVKAQTTYTMGLLKYGLIDYPGKYSSGRVKVLDIGFPPAVTGSVGKPSTFIDSLLVKKLLPERRRNAHKGSYGHCGILGGKQGYEGAALLASKAALRSGCGLVTVYFSPERVVKPDEVIRRILPSEIDTLPEDIDLEHIFIRNNALVIGPGMGLFPNALRLIRQFLALEKKILIDADGLNNIAQDPDVLNEKKGDVVITPHIGEMSRLTGIEKGDIKQNKKEVAGDFAKKYGITVVLKDAVTVIASSGETFFNDGGVPALAKGGSGDVLAGIIGSLMARGLSGKDAAVAGVYIHTECGRIAGERTHDDCVQAGDLIALLPDVFKSLRDFC